jgi:hypothetical protein
MECDKASMASAHWHLKNNGDAGTTDAKSQPEALSYKPSFRGINI